MTADEKPSIAELQRQTGEPDQDNYCLRCHEQMSVPVELEPSALCDRCAQQFVAEDAPVLLEIAAAGLAWKEARDVSIGDAYLRCPAGPSKESRDQLAAAATALLTALEKVQP